HEPTGFGLWHVVVPYRGASAAGITACSMVSRRWSTRAKPVRDDGTAGVDRRLVLGWIPATAGSRVTC
ncbi:MAG: hypothetical protein OXC29_08585, partial [Rhodococcus sp.]|nr:hypothetical protein [Rhodococcus sp. (in: high G+C Gram-positive bacteria)]